MSPLTDELTNLVSDRVDLGSKSNSVDGKPWGQQSLVTLLGKMQPRTSGTIARGRIATFFSIAPLQAPSVPKCELALEQIAARVAENKAQRVLLVTNSPDRGLQPHARRHRPLLPTLQAIIRGTQVDRPQKYQESRSHTGVYWYRGPWPDQSHRDDGVSLLGFLEVCRDLYDWSLLCLSPLHLKRHLPPLKHSDEVVLVAERNCTQRTQICRAVHQLDTQGITIQGLLMLDSYQSQTAGRVA